MFFCFCLFEGRSKIFVYVHVTFSYSELAVMSICVYKGVKGKNHKRVLSNVLLIVGNIG